MIPINASYVQPTRSVTNLGQQWSVIQMFSKMLLRAIFSCKLHGCSFVLHGCLVHCWIWYNIKQNSRCAQSLISSLLHRFHTWKRMRRLSPLLAGGYPVFFDWEWMGIKLHPRFFRRGVKIPGNALLRVKKKLGWSLIPIHPQSKNTGYPIAWSGQMPPRPQ